MNQARIESFAGQVVSDMAASMSAVLTDLGRSLGLYAAMDGAGPLSAAEVASRTRTKERYIREWLNNQAAGGYVNYDAGTDRYELPAEHGMVLANVDSPMYLAEGFNTVSSVWKASARLSYVFQNGGGIGWHEHDGALHLGTEYFYRTGYRANLTSAWIPALEGVEEKLRDGAKVADVGCGHAASTIIMAQAYPQSTFWGFDYHQTSVETARERAREAGVDHRIGFSPASARQYPGRNYDLICFMDCLHDLGDPLAAAQHARKAIANDGTVMLVEPFAGDRIEDNLNPIGRLFYAASTTICTPNSLSQDGAAGLGAQAGETRLREIFLQAGFRSFRRAAQTPFNLVLEARP